MLNRQPFRYKIQLQNMATGETKEVDYVVHWSPEKVDAHEVGTACRIEHTVAGGFDANHQPRTPWLNISQELQQPVTLKEKAIA